MLTTHGCEVDKPSGDVLQVCRVAKVTDLDRSRQASVRNGAMRNTLYLGMVQGLGDAYVDFRYVHRVLRTDLQAADANARRIVSMTVDGRIALQEHLYRYHTRRLPGAPLPDDPDDV